MAAEREQIRHGYRSGISGLCGLAEGAGMVVAIQVVGHVLLMLGRLRLNAAIAVVSAVAQLGLVLVLAVIGHLTGLTVVLMKPFGIIGAALASFLAYWALALAMLTLASRAAGELPLARSLRRPTREDWVVGQAFHFAGRIRSLVLN